MIVYPDLAAVRWSLGSCILLMFWGVDLQRCDYVPARTLVLRLVHEPYIQYNTIQRVPVSWYLELRQQRVRWAVCVS